MSRLDAIRARLAAATPGPWAKDPRGGGVIRGGAIVHKVRGSGQPQIALVMAHEEEDIGSQGRNAEFIAHAPDDVAWLLAEVDAWRQLNVEADELVSREQAERDALKAQLADMKALALKYVDTPSAVFDVHTDVVVRWHGDAKATQDLLVYCRRKHDERGNGYGEGAEGGIFYVDPDDFAAFCRKYLEEHAKGNTR